MKWWILATYFVATVAYAEFAEHEMYSDPNWVTVADLDMSKGDDCPLHWNKVAQYSTSMCRAVITGDAKCLGVTFKVNGIKYNKTLGMIRGYQKGTTDGFRASHDDNAGINEAYVDGVSITIGDPRKHVWTYAAGLSAEENRPKGNCPCSPTRGPNPPAFVGENYYCQSGSRSSPDHDTYYMLPLWMGSGCTNDRDNCCANTGAPWFYREFPTPQDEDIEVRICYSHRLADEAVLVEKIHISIYNVQE